MTSKLLPVISKYFDHWIMRRQRDWIIKNFKGSENKLMDVVEVEGK